MYIKGNYSRVRNYYKSAVNKLKKLGTHYTKKLKNYKLYSKKYEKEIFYKLGQIIDIYV